MRQQRVTQRFSSFQSHVSGARVRVSQRGGERRDLRQMETGRGVFLKMFHDLSGRVHDDAASAVEHQDRVAVLKGDIEIVRHQNDAESLSLQTYKEGDKFPSRPGVEPRRRFVEDEVGGLARKNGGDGDLSLLAAREVEGAAREISFVKAGQRKSRRGKSRYPAFGNTPVARAKISSRTFRRRAAVRELKNQADRAADVEAGRSSP